MLTYAGCTFSLILKVIRVSQSDFIGQAYTSLKINYVVLLHIIITLATALPIAFDSPSRKRARPDDCCPALPTMPAHRDSFALCWTSSLSNHPLQPDYLHLLGAPRPPTPSPLYSGYCFPVACLSSPSPPRPPTKKVCWSFPVFPSPPHTLYIFCSMPLLCTGQLITVSNSSFPVVHLYFFRNRERLRGDHHYPVILGHLDGPNNLFHYQQVQSAHVIFNVDRGGSRLKKTSEVSWKQRIPVCRKTSVFFEIWLSLIFSVSTWRIYLILLS